MDIIVVVLQVLHLHKFLDLLFVQLLSDEFVHIAVGVFDAELEGPLSELVDWLVVE